MSHDISLNCAHCGSRVFEANVTGNLTPMLRESRGFYLGDERWKGQSGVTMLPAVQGVIDDMTDDPGRFREHNPENGWGDYDGALETLRALRDAIARHPDATYQDWH